MKINNDSATPTAAFEAFDEPWYIDNNPDVPLSGMTAKEHYDKVGRKQGRAGALDPIWYALEYPETRLSGLTPKEHYRLHGKSKGYYPFFDREWYVSEYQDVAESGMDPLTHYLKIGKLGGRHPAFHRDWYLLEYPDIESSGQDALAHYREYGRKEGRFPPNAPLNKLLNNYRNWIHLYDTLSESARAELGARTLSFRNKPLISVIMPVYNPQPEYLEEAINSVLEQIYPRWELCIADDSSTDSRIRPILERYARLDSRIKVVFREKNGHISASSNSAVEVATGEWTALLDHDDRLAEQALFWVVNAINENPAVGLIFSDEDKITKDGVRFSPYFKCDWNPELLHSHNMFSHLGVYRADLIRKVGGFRLGYEGSQDLDLVLRCSEHVKPEQITHIPRVLYHWRAHAESTASSAEAKPYAMRAGERAINDQFERLGIEATAQLTGSGYRVNYKLPVQAPLVTIIIPTRDGLALLEQCIDSILTKTTYRNFEIVIVDNGSKDSATLKYLEKLVTDDLAIVIRDDSPFNYSRLNNLAADRANGEILCLLNNDIEVIAPEWLSEMVSHAVRPGVGVVGSKLLYPNDSVQHAGVVLGMLGVAGHIYKGIGRTEFGYFGKALLAQSMSAVTGACLVVKKSIYKTVGGLDQKNLAIAFNDIDFCIRVKNLGYRNIWTPYAELYHHESASRGLEDTPEKRARFLAEIAHMQSTHDLSFDPAYSPNLTLDLEDCSLAWPPRMETFGAANQAFAEHGFPAGAHAPSNKLLNSERLRLDMIWRQKLGASYAETAKEIQRLTFGVNCPADLANLEPALFVTAIYQIVLGRLPDTDGLRTYLGHLTDGLSRDVIIKEILYSSESISRNNDEGFVDIYRTNTTRFFRPSPDLALMKTNLLLFKLISERVSRITRECLIVI